jgi:hypothetical protein
VFSHKRKLVISSAGVSFWCVSLLHFLPFCVCLVFLPLFVVISSVTLYCQPLIYGVFSVLWWRMYVYGYSTNGLELSFVGLPIPLFCLLCQMFVSHRSHSIYTPQKTVPIFWEHSNELSVSYTCVKAGNCWTSFKVWGFDGGVCSHYSLLVVTPHSLCCGYQHFGKQRRSHLPIQNE